jgi:hypothetical protein
VTRTTNPALTSPLRDPRSDNGGLGANVRVMRKREVLDVRGVIVVLLVAAAAVAPCDYLFPPARSLETWGVLWN